MLNEADTRVKLIDPMLHQAGWTEDKIIRERFITPGRILDERGNRRRGKNLIISFSQFSPHSCS